MKRRAMTAVLAASLFCAANGAAAPRSDAPAHLMRAELPGKPTGPIAVEHRSAAPAVGVPLTITVTARVDGDVRGLSIEANATEPRAVLVTQPLPVSTAERVYSWEVTVVPLVADAGYLSVIVSGLIDGVDQARSVTVSLRSAVAHDTPHASAPRGETLIALPVQESP